MFSEDIMPKKRFCSTFPQAETVAAAAAATAEVEEEEATVSEAEPDEEEIEEDEAEAGLDNVPALTPPNTRTLRTRLSTGRTLFSIMVIMTMADGLS